MIAAKRLRIPPEVLFVIFYPPWFMDSTCDPLNLTITSCVVPATIQTTIQTMPECCASGAPCVLVFCTMDRPTIIVIGIAVAVFLIAAVRNGTSDFQGLLVVGVLCAAAAFIAIGIVNTFQIGTQNYQDSKQGGENLHRFFAQRLVRNFQRIDNIPQDQSEVRPYLDRYYLLTKNRSLELKATSAFKGAIHSFPACFMVTYEKTDVMGAAIGAGNLSSISEFQGILVAVQMPTAFTGKTMIIRKLPEAPDNWLATRPLGSRTFIIETGLTQAFTDNFILRSTHQDFRLSQHLQELLLRNSELFFNSADKESALVLDKQGWGYVSTLITDEPTLNRLADFQESLTQALAK